MTINPITSNLGLQTSLTSALQSNVTTLNNLTSELSSQQKHSNLTDYSATDARNLINLQGTATQTQAYISVIQGASNNLSIYDTTLTDLESVTAQAQNLADTNATYDPQNSANIAAEAANFLGSVGADLNQQINGRYIYAGARYDTAPVQNLTNLSTSTLSPTIYSDNTTLPTYDSGTSSLISFSGNTVTVGGAATTENSATVVVGGTPYSVTVTSGESASAIATALAGVVPNSTASGGALTLSSGTIDAAYATNADAAAYATDQATIATGYNINYGVTSNDPSFQQLIAGLRYLQAAGNATDATTYKANITQAQALLSSALPAIQSVHTNVANNIGAMTNEQNAQNTTITNLTDQVDNIQQVDVTQVTAEITSLETILQASYSATGSILQMSIVSYL